MKNFPHQVNDLGKLSRALKVVSELIEEQEEVEDDESFGEALTRAKVYTYRKKDLSIQQFLQAEKKKPRASRGSETAARDIRRFLTLAGLIKADDDGENFKLTARGKELLESDEETQSQHWREALLNLALVDNNGNLSHPYRVLLRLLEEVPDIETGKLMLALEARDDTEEEFQRLLSFTAKDLETIRNELGFTESNARNAVKILPGIARQLGDLASGDSGVKPNPRPVVTEEGIAPPGPPPNPKPIAIDAEDIGKDPAFGAGGESLVDLGAANETRKQRTLVHQKAVRSLAKMLEEDGYDLFEHPFDCLAAQDGRSTLLIEVKTLDGSPSDERQQAARALGQLSAYAYFNIPKKLKKGELQLVAAFTQRPMQATIDFLKHNDIHVIWLEEGEWVDGDSSPFTPADL
jgi:hypothetical protein